MLILRRYLAYMLCLSMVLTTQAMALAQAAAGPAGAVELCTGTGPVTVLVDENGEPTGRPHICPDCIAQALTAILPPDLPSFAAGVTRAPAQTRHRIAAVTRPGLPPRARAPPSLV